MGGVWSSSAGSHMSCSQGLYETSQCSVSYLNGFLLMGLKLGIFSVLISISGAFDDDDALCRTLLIHLDLGILLISVYTHTISSTLAASFCTSDR